MKVIPLKLEIEFKEGMDIAKIITDFYDLNDKDIIVIAHKIVSKAEGRIVSLDSIKPSQKALELAKKHDKDPKVVEVILEEAKDIVRERDGIIITETRHGFICANSGVDRSNVKDGLVLLPLDPDRSAYNIRKRIKELTNKEVAVIISDTFGRPFREGQVNIAIGVSGINPLKDYKGKKDIYGYELRVTNIAIADELASAAELVMNKSDKTPIAIIRGYDYEIADGSIKPLIRDKANDLFR
ncbi:MAG: coenzyme F420-0:L-glutamate ligase [Candidatus Nitrosothermus koennekii]|nr:MAG: coenzyme F420-0:L-glutamate ligase [Candidatus Nitrosothermus koennekii]